jgi:hypothetical protein
MTHRRDENQGGIACGGRKSKNITVKPPICRNAGTCVSAPHPVPMIPTRIVVPSDEDDVFGALVVVAICWLSENDGGRATLATIGSV